MYKISILLFHFFCGVPVDVNSKSNYLKLFTQYYSRALFLNALSQIIILVFFFILFSFFGKGVTFSIDYSFLFLKKHHFYLVAESWSKISSFNFNNLASSVRSYQGRSFLTAWDIAPPPPYIAFSSCYFL